MRANYLIKKKREKNKFQTKQNKTNRNTLGLVK